MSRHIKKIKLGVVLLFLLLLLVFAVQNAAVVEIRLLLWQVAISRSLLIFVMFLSGVFAGWILRGTLRVSWAKR